MKNKINSMKYKLDILNGYIDRGLVIRQQHPTLPLSIYNYSRKCQYDGLWDEVTKDCRGLVLDSEGNVIAKPFPKFFNYEELVGNKWNHSEIPNEPFEVFEKMDGSLGILFNYEGEWIMATRGSFQSEQAIKGMDLLSKYKYEKLIKGFTYLFEIVYSENRIVCDYDFEDLILLAVIDNKDGYELQIHDDDIHIEGIRFRNLYNNLGLKVVKKYDEVKDFNILKNSISNNQEGYVVRFKNGMRMKIKGDEYVRLHRILTNFSSIDIWELVKNGKPIEPFLERVPDEFDKWVKSKISNLQYAHFSISERCGKAHDYFRYGKYSDVYPEPTKKEYVEYIKKYTEPMLHHIMFAMWNGKRTKVDELIWKLLKPKYEKPFTNDIDN